MTTSATTGSCTSAASRGGCHLRSTSTPIPIPARRTSAPPSTSPTRAPVWIPSCVLLASDPRWHARAVTLLEPATNDEGIWASANNSTFMTFAHAQAGDVDNACAAGLQASAAVRVGGSVRNAAILAQIHADLAARYPGDARVKELAEALA